ncbi:CS domain protein (macronuclear) [Tetrahymena thermophila SB210]|uniref:CS domain protein n=1 Tax=Tetrahymena thermophila (strain SB210) TaxID=312017 RepID=Q23DJ4_TETTS|nr:CS domain protein [Tetrahymena thermophila SB210]EAR94413.2 CS domain protein [Tetrahymena thermophila SB210]|eukprot:XP_001014692.2 CS domain protein [Tetrahymena thermophila SB210]
MAQLATPFSWAQRRDRIFISINLRDITEEKIDLQPTSLSFDCTSDKKQYHGVVNFYDEIDVESSKKTILGFGARIVLFKKNTEAPYWPRLTKEGGKHNNITFDWERYIDSDEEGEDGDKGLGQDWDPSQMQHFGGPGGEEDSDDDEEGAGQNVNDLDDEEEIDAKKEEDNADQNDEKKE